MVRMLKLENEANDTVRLRPLPSSFIVIGVDASNTRDCARNIHAVSHTIHVGARNVQTAAHNVHAVAHNIHVGMRAQKYSKLETAGEQELNTEGLE
eukprot:4114003-Pyramimonas_sp.AAC.1